MELVRENHPAKRETGFVACSSSFSFYNGLTRRSPIAVVIGAGFPPSFLGGVATKPPFGREELYLALEKQARDLILRLLSLSLEGKDPERDPFSFYEAPISNEVKKLIAAPKGCEKKKINRRRKTIKNTGP